MSVRNINGSLYVRFQIDGKEYSAPTGLADTERNQRKAAQIEAGMRREVIEGRGDSLKIRACPFNDAVTMFLAWAKGEYVDSSYRRLKSSFAFALEHFGSKALARITPGDLEDFKGVRREQGLKEVSIRHDLHAFSLLFQHGIKHNICRHNPVEKVEIPSDAEAVRINPLSRESEVLYLDTCRKLDAGMQANRQARYWSRDAYAELSDFARLMIQQGCRPEEFFELRKKDVDLASSYLFIRSGKSDNAKRRLKLTAGSKAILVRRLSTPGPWVFPSPWSAANHRSTFQRSHDAVIAACGVAAVLYDFRHTFASRAAMSGMPLPVLAAILGHSPKNLRSVMHYVHVQSVDMDREMDRLEPETKTKPEKIRKNLLTGSESLSTVWDLEKKS